MWQSEILNRNVDVAGWAGNAESNSEAGIPCQWKGGRGKGCLGHVMDKGELVIWYLVVFIWHLGCRMYFISYWIHPTYWVQEPHQEDQREPGMPLMNKVKFIGRCSFVSRCCDTSEEVLSSPCSSLFCCLHFHSLHCHCLRWCYLRCRCLRLCCLRCRCVWLIVFTSH